MSWAEIKKAVNSRMADMPLDDMFGLEYVRNFALNRNAVTVSNISGIASITSAGGYSASQAVVSDGRGNSFTVYGTYGSMSVGATQVNGIIPLDKDCTYTFTDPAQNATSTATIFFVGGYILTALRNLFVTPSEGRC